MKPQSTAPILPVFLSLTLLATSPLPAAESDLAARISGMPVMYQHLLPVGAAQPTDAESAILLADLQQVRKAGIEPGLPSLEQFISEHPNSPWLPSLHANLGRYYRERGLYSKALKHWETAWNATRTAANGPAKEVADFTFAHWTRLPGKPWPY
jgi:hypothetical protein